MDDMENFGSDKNKTYIEPIIFIQIHIWLLPKTRTSLPRIMTEWPKVYELKYEKEKNVQKVFLS